MISSIDFANLKKISSCAVKATKKCITRGRICIIKSKSYRR